MLAGSRWPGRMQLRVGGASFDSLLASARDFWLLYHTDLHRRVRALIVGLVFTRGIEGGLRFMYARPVFLGF